MKTWAMRSFYWWWKQKMLFDRYIEVLVGNKKITSDDLEINLDIPFTEGKEQDIAEVVIYNLSESTINDIREHKNINIMAGYRKQNNVANIFTGVVKTVVVNWVGRDKETTLLLADGGYQWASSRLKKSYPKGSKASNIMRDIINLMGFKPAQVAPKEDKIYPDGFIVNGLKKDELNRLIKETQSTMVTEKGFVYINSGESITETGFILNADTGLVGSPTLETDNDDEGKKKPDTYNVTMLLNPLIVKGSKLKVESHALTGEVQVIEGKHDKDFNTVVKVRRV